MRLTLITLMVVLAFGCGPKKDIKPARAAMEAGNWDEAYRLWSGLLEKHPGDTHFKIAAERARLNAVLSHLRKASIYYEKDLLDEAQFEVQIVLSLDPLNQEAQNMIARIAESREAEREAEAVADRNRQKAFSSLPQLKPSTWAPLDITFTNQSARDIYMSLGKAYGLNVVVDSKLRDEKVTIDLKGMSLMKALDTLMVLNRHFFKVVDENTIIILEDDRTTRERYDTQIIQTFYLSNITSKEIGKHLRSLGGIKEFAENEALNAITVKGTPEQIALIGKIIADNDKAQPEVVVELELLEVNKGNMRKLGIMPVSSADGGASYRAGILADPRNRSDSDENSGGIRGIFPDLSSEDFLTVVPALAIDFLKQQDGSKQVANPHLRVTSGSQGHVRIGQSVPVAQTSFTNAQISGSASGSNSFGDNALTSFKYQDVGIDIKVTPRVHYNNEITLELELEISSVVSSGIQPVFGKRNVKTSIRLKNGETNVLMGLLNNEERKSLVGIPGLSDIPLLGRLFSNDDKVISQTDIILSTRPVIIRGPNVSAKDRAPFELSSLRLDSLYQKPDEEKEESTTEEPEGERIKLDKKRKKATKSSYEDDDEAEDSEDEEGASEDDMEEEAAPAMLAFTPAVQDSRVGDHIDFSLFVTNVEGFRRGEIVLEYDPEVIQAVQAELGDFFGAQGNRPLMTPAWDNSKGRLTMVITQRMGAEAFSGSGILANLKFHSKGVGRGDLTFRRLELTTKDKEVIPADGLNARYEVSP